MDIYVVKENENINDIAKRFNLSVNDLQTVNDINLYELSIGDEINIPLLLSKDFDYYEVKEGDTLKNIANGKKINPEVLASLNGLDISDYIYPNQTILIPKDNVTVYITSKGDTIRVIEKELSSNLETILQDNPEIYLVENQLLITREIT